MGSALYGLMAGLVVSLIPGAKRKKGGETLNVEQHRPPIAYIIGYGILFVAFIGFPIYCYVNPKIGLDIGLYIFSIVGISPLGFILVFNCYNYYHCFTESGIRWRNWRRKVRYIDYSSIYKVSYENSAKCGWVKIWSTQLPKRRKLGFDADQFNPTVLCAQLVYRLEYDRWATPEEYYSEEMQEILGRRDLGNVLWKDAFMEPLVFPVEADPSAAASHQKTR